MVQRVRKMQKRLPREDQRLEFSAENKTTSNYQRNRRFLPLDPIWDRYAKIRVSGAVEIAGCQ